MKIKIMCLAIVTLSGCASLAMAQQQREAALQARINSLSPEDRERVGKCVAETQGKIATLRLAQQAGMMYAFWDEADVVEHCLNNPYFASSVPSPRPPMPIMPYVGP